jgi:transcriptional regulator with XRE-family HTH domain
MTKRFRDAFLDRLKEGDLTLADVARGSGVSVEQLKKVRQRDTASTNVDDAMKIAHYFGLSLDEFLGDTTIKDRTEMLDLYMQLSPQERDLLLDVARVRAARGREA